MPFNRETILIVDDNRMNIAAIRASLKSLMDTYDLVEVQRGGDALKATKLRLPTLILLDIRLPDMTGFEVAKALKAARATRNIPIIFISGLDDVDSKLQGFMTGGVDYITKPFHRQEVLARVQTQLKIHSLQSNLETRNNEISESIAYAKNIQKAILPTREQFKRAFSKHFIFYRPKDVLSGDVFWLREYHGDWLVACLDCTGHGIPGALISIVGNSLLEQVCTIDDDLNPGEMLKHINDRFVSTLNQRDDSSRVQDGIDMALCRINRKENTVIFSGAYRPIFQIRNKTIIEWKGSKYPVGGTQEAKKNFANHKIRLQKGDEIILFTDGYSHQFGGKEGKKLSGKKFKEIIQGLAGKNSTEQKNGLKKQFELWKGNLEQVDDVLVIGLKF